MGGVLHIGRKITDVVRSVGVRHELMDDLMCDRIALAVGRGLTAEQDNAWNTRRFATLAEGVDHLDAKPA
jgi:hypothetical protein